MKSIARILFVAVTLGILGGCASDPRASQGLQWVTEQQSERARLQAQGFPQYSNF